MAQINHKLTHVYGIQITGTLHYQTLIYLDYVSGIWVSGIHKQYNTGYFYVPGQRCTDEG